MLENKLLVSPQEIKAMSDPYRMRIMNTYFKLGRPATVKQIADDMGEIPANVHYHVKKLEKIGILSLVYTEEINGIVAKFYEPVARAFSIDGSNLPYEILKDSLPEFNKLVYSVLEEGKNEFTVALNKWDGKKESRVMVSLEDIYLTDEEYNEFIILINKLTTKSAKKDKQNLKLYKLFANIIALKEDI